MSTHSVPEMTTDEEAEAFLDQDLSDLDFTEFQPLDLDGRVGHRAAGRHPRA